MKPSKRLLALFAAGIVVAASTLVILGQLHSATASLPAPGRDATAITQDALSHIGGLADVGSSVAATGTPAAGVADIASDLEAKLTAAQNELKAKLDAAAALPTVPADYSVGADVSANLAPGAVQSFVPPQFMRPLMLSDFQSFTVSGSRSPAMERTAPHAPPTGQPAADSLMGTLLGSYGELSTAWAIVNGTALPAGVPGVPALPGGLPLPAGVPGVPALPVPGGLLGTGYPAPVAGANDVADPDAAGALSAAEHASGLLSVTTHAIQGSNASLTSMLTAYDGLAAAVQGVIDSTHSVATKARTDIPAQLATRLAEFTAQEAALKSQATRVVGGYRATVGGALDAAQTADAAALTDHLSALQDRVAAQQASLSQAQANLQALASTHSQEIRVAVAQATADLEAWGKAHAANVAANVGAVEAAGHAANATLALDVKARMASLQEASDALTAAVAPAQARLSTIVQVAMALANTTVATSLQEADRVQGFLVAVATATADRDTAAARDAATTTLANLDILAQAHIRSVVDDALNLTASADGTVNATATLADQVAGLTGTEVGKDVSFIAKVAGDYGRVPTPQRQAEAGYWAGVAGVYGSALNETLLQGGSLPALAQSVVDRAAQARTQILALV
ncbi:MAG: hypothetical protein ACYDBQ_06830 [Thermoplasmatota archaeon]